MGGSPEPSDRASVLFDSTVFPDTVDVRTWFPLGGQVESDGPSMALTLWFDYFGTRSRLQATAWGHLSKA